MIRALRTAFLCLFALLPLAAQGQQEVVLTASAGSRLAVGLPSPQAAGVDQGRVDKDFTATLRQDLEEAGPFSLLKGTLPRTVDEKSHKAWVEAGADWLLILKVGRSGEDVRIEAQVVDVRPGKQVFAKAYTGREAALRRMAHTLSDDLVYMLTRERGVASSRIVFVRDMGRAVKEIFQVDRDGSNPVQLTHHRSLTISPSVDDKEGKLAYVTYKSGSPEIWGQKTPGGPHVKLAPVGQYTGHTYCPVWSPDGKRLAFSQVTSRSGDTDIMVLDLESGKVRRLTYNACGNTDPTWNPTGTQIAFTSDRDGSAQVFLMESDGSNMRRLTMEGSYNTSPAWSPSGAMIAYVSRFESKFDLFVYKLGEGKSYQITLGVASSESPSWSPDERRLVFTSGSKGGMRLYTTDLSGNSMAPLGETSGCQSPKWARSR